RVRAMVWFGCKDAHGSWNTICTLRRSAPSKRRPGRKFSPRTEMWPFHSRSSPASTRRRVDLPQPDSPIRLKVSPFSMAKLAAETAVFSPKLTRSWLTSTSAIVGLLPRLRTVERRQHLAERPGVRAAGPERARVRMGCLRQLARRHFINFLTLIHHQHAVTVFR